jgi:hypothetical protein
MTIRPSIRFVRKWTSASAAAVILCLLTPVAHAQESFETPDEAAAQLAAAVKSGSQRDILKVLGSAGKDIVSSGDNIADAEDRQRFAAAYDIKHSVNLESDKKAVILLGTDEFPFPIPLARNKAGWRFDAAAGRLEILYRRIGRNELAAIQTCLAYVRRAERICGEGPYR